MLQHLLFLPAPAFLPFLVKGDPRAASSRRDCPAYIQTSQESSCNNNIIIQADSALLGKPSSAHAIIRCASWRTTGPCAGRRCVTPPSSQREESVNNTSPCCEPTVDTIPF